MISLKKYLWATGGAVATAEPESAELPLALCAALLEAVRDQVLKGSEYSHQRDDLNAVLGRLDPPMTIDAADVIRETIQRVLLSYATALQRRETNVSIEMQQILGTLNQALTALASGNERSLSRLQQIQESLQRTSVLQDMAALKSSLAQTMRFIREESNQERQASSKQLTELEAELGKAREVISRTRTTLQGRPEGIRHISEELRTVPPEFALYLVAYRFERLQAVVQRYGADAGEDLIFRMIRERVQPLAPSGVSFRWTPSSLVAVFQRSRNLPEIRMQAAALNRSPLVCSVPLGNRTATLSLHPSHLVAEGASDSAEALIAEADQFTGAAM